MLRPPETRAMLTSTFEREAKWLLVITLVPVVAGILIAILWPAIARWLAAR